MVAISAANTATPSLQSVLGRVRVAQARREADQAQANAQNLRSLADQAESKAQQSQGRWLDLSQRSQQADPTYQPRKPGQSSGRILDLRA
ncbi:MAG: hypothetical protein KJ614_03325 [Gammaproteobacteria bacterium]|uniref:hypothetical protein n=1 Tax=Rhodoferax sp. TaxID=50421 RepID=UPI001790EF86|nr:hypothetical protein [Rhodoferax sp.]MBU3897948.1 hypothetical protein [Gammaproteobacteria bacterium]MBA3056874.1 hypothetical protein [Rhodoferax sp.]MBU3996307.1 hypothetical protein [Gammaproteobacteria bacterium]MBU4018609.1 hypothetical protein [Gammaproteobacteria bacterium]MBU4080844.1 hypothetical protein [Gammaproteobacteria bacterium]